MYGTIDVDSDMNTDASEDNYPHLILYLLKLNYCFYSFIALVILFRATYADFLGTLFWMKLILTPVHCEYAGKILEKFIDNSV